jgi:hypothetical protein
MYAKRPTVTLEPKRVAFVLGIIIAALLAAHCIGLVMSHVFHHDHIYGLVPLFHFGMEQNVPTFFSTLLILINAALFICAWNAARTMGEKRWIWLFLTIIFCFLAFDEFLGLHERLEAPTRDALNAGGLFYFAWIIPYMAAVLVLAIFVAPVIWRLGGRIRARFILSAAVYLAGAVGIEMIGGAIF